MLRSIPILVLTATLLPVGVTAQPAPQLSAGDRVRIWTPEHHPVAGRVVAVGEDAVELLSDRGGAAVPIPHGSIQRAEISRGGANRKRGFLRGATWGALILGSIGALSLGLQHEQVGGRHTSAGEAAALGAFSGVLFGTLLGGAIGAARSGEKWQPLYP